MYFKRKKNECIDTGARRKLHKIKIDVIMTYFVTKNAS